MRSDIISSETIGTLLYIFVGPASLAGWIDRLLRRCYISVRKGPAER